MAQGILQFKLKNIVLNIEVDSAGTSSYHVGSIPDLRTINTLKKHGIILHHLARKLVIDDIKHYNYILAMDHLNYEEIVNIAGDSNTKHIFLLRSFDILERNQFDIPDPYYGLDKDFEEVFQICSRSIDGFIAFLHSQSLINNNLNHGLLTGS